MIITKETKTRKEFIIQRKNRKESEKPNLDDSDRLRSSVSCTPSSGSPRWKGWRHDLYPALRTPTLRSRTSEKKLISKSCVFRIMNCISYIGRRVKYKYLTLVGPGWDGIFAETIGVVSAKTLVWMDVRRLILLFILFGPKTLFSAKTFFTWHQPVCTNVFAENIYLVSAKSPLSWHQSECTNIFAEIHRTFSAKVSL